MFEKCICVWGAHQVNIYCLIIVAAAVVVVLPGFLSLHFRWSIGWLIYLFVIQHMQLYLMLKTENTWQIEEE